MKKYIITIPDDKQQFIEELLNQISCVKYKEFEITKSENILADLVNVAEKINKLCPQNTNKNNKGSKPISEAMANIDNTNN